MALLLKATGGPLAGQVFPVENGVTLGRQAATINLGDPRASSVHAQIVETDGRWYLQDQNSKNGIRNAAGDRIDNLELKPGAAFVIGSGEFTVEKGELAATPPSDGAAAPKVRKPEKPKKKQIYWNEALAEFLENGIAKFKDKAKPIAPLDPALVLEFVRGAQVNARWVIGFGPRKIGPTSLDLPIWEAGAPPVCFEIFPSPDGLIFKTEHPQIVRLNGRAVDNGVLRMGDTITINDTLIEVDFSE